MNKTTPSMIRIICPNLKCRAILSTPIKTRGQAVRCRMCGAHVRVPDPTGKSDAESKG